MRATVEFTVSGNDFQELRERAESKWKKLANDAEATLPISAEMNITESGANLDARVIVRTKVGEE
jgi:hypothetical protein